MNSVVQKERKSQNSILTYYLICGIFFLLIIYEYNKSIFFFFLVVCMFREISANSILKRNKKTVRILEKKTYFEVYNLSFYLINSEYRELLFTCWLSKELLEKLAKSKTLSENFICGFQNKKYLIESQN